MVAAKENSLSVRERIVQGIETALLAVDGTGSYRYDVRRAIRGQQHKGKLQVYPSCYIYEVSERKGEGNFSPLGVVGCVLSIVVVIWGREPDDGGRPTEANELLGDLKRAVLANQQWGGLAISTRIVSNKQELSEALVPYGGNALSLEIIYRHLRTDPSAVR